MIVAEELSKSFLIKPKKTSFFSKTTFEEKRAVDHVSFQIARGELVGYIGPNGAGKSTTIKMMTGILHPDNGTIRVGGLNPFMQRKENTKNIGVIFGQRSQLWWHLKLEDTYLLLKHIYQIPDQKYKEKLAILRQRLDLDEFWSQPVRQLSLGQRMRGELAAALLHSPAVLFLDEPTVGMDVLVKEKIRSLLSEINQQDGITIVLTSHDLEDIERLCSRIIVINHGHVLYNGSMKALRDCCAADTTVSIDMGTQTPILSPALRNVKQEGYRLSFSLNRNLGEGHLLTEIIAQNPVRDISITEPPIEDVIRDLYSGGDPA